MNKNVQDIVYCSEIDKIAHDGRGITNLNAKKVFIPGALPGEVVQFQIRKKYSKYLEATLTNINAPSPMRNPNVPCEHFGVCGGCNLQHMMSQQQLAFKQDVLLNQLKQFGNVVPEELLSPLQTETVGYRHKARLGVKFVEKKNKLLVGFRERNSRYLADLNRCAVLIPAVGEQITLLAELVASLKASREIPQIELAAGDDETALVFRHLVDLQHDDLEKLSAFGQRHQFHIYLQPNKPHPLIKLYPHDNCHRLTYSLPGEGLTYQFHPLDFTQINLNMNRKMVALALQLLELKANDTVLDLFCGIGNFSLPLAKHSGSVVGIEGSEEMVQRAYENAAHNHIKNIQFYAANLEAPSPNATWLKQQYEKILLDPPRVGAKTMIPYLNQLGANRIVYVSCNPATLARDAGQIVHEQGYLLKAVGAMDMFPQTAHIEAIALFCKP